MKIIYKYPLEKDEVILPKGAQILTVQIQRNSLFVWALVDPHQEETETRKVERYGTGELIPEIAGHIYINTVFEFEGTYVWHFFQVIPPSEYTRCPNVS